MSTVTQVGQSILSSIRQGVSELVSVAREIAKEIKGIIQRIDNQIPRLNFNFSTSKTEAGSTAKDFAELKLSGYQLLQDKVKGVEAGFVSQKEWNTNEHEKPLLESGHPFNSRAKEWLSEQLTGNMYRKSAEKLFTLGLEKLQQNTAALSKLDDTSLQQLEEIGSEGPKHGSFEGFTQELKNAAFQEALASLPDKEFSKLHQGIKKTLIAENHVFTDRHHTRLPDIKTGSLLAKFAIYKAKHTGSTADILNIINKLSDIDRKATIGEAAHQEVVNKFAEKMGIKTQHLEVKFIGDMHTGTGLLQSSQPRDFTDFNGKSDTTKGRIYLKDGVLVQNTPNKNDPTVFDGPPILYKGIDELGRNKIKMLILGDRDPLSNKGIVKKEGKTQFFSAESKHILRKELKDKKVGVNSDFSMDSKSQHKLMDHKNLTIFDQSTFAEKMEGVRKIQELKESKEDVKSLTPGLKNLYIERRDEVLKTFENRLAVDNFIFSGTENTADKKTAIDQTLNLLDGLEKLSSKTVGTANGRENGIRLDIPQIQNSADRKAWNVQQSGDQIQFTFEGKASEAEDILKTLQDFNAKGPGPSTAYDFRRGPDNSITVTVNSADIAQAQAALSYENIMDYKHPPTTS